MKKVNLKVTWSNRQIWPKSASIYTSCLMSSQSVIKNYNLFTVGSWRWQFAIVGQANVGVKTFHSTYTHESERRTHFSTDAWAVNLCEMTFKKEKSHARATAVRVISVNLSPPGSIEVDKKGSILSPFVFLRANVTNLRSGAHRAAVADSANAEPCQETS